ncbi:MAG TPA: winged helix-turn-helix domain-containing protein [Candidatus Sulfotelmatobacter sp.]|nr:winged helix-turn-helix domain-containing protein [Candidatus Sulfotelmatobacter sp.]
MGKSAIPARLAFGVFEVDAQAGELRKHGIRVKLQDREFHVLLMLLQNPGHVVTRYELQQSLWPGDTFVEFDNGLNNAISRLRNALGDSAESPRFIETVPRHGYRFVASVTSDDIPSVRVPLLSRRPVQIALIVVALAATVLITYSLTERAPRIGSLAVLPFSTVNPTDMPGQQYLGSSMTDAVLLNLSNVHGLRIVPLQTARHYSHSNEPLAEIAHELRVDAIASGSVQPEGNDLQVNVRLVRSADDAPFWTGSYRERASQFVALTREVTSGIIQAGNLDLTSSERQRLAEGPQVNSQAYVDFLKGRYYMSQSTEASYTEALSYFEQAVAEAPNFARGYEGLADYYEITDALPPSVAMPKAKLYALKALNFNDMLPSAHASLAVAYFYGDWNWKSSEQEFRRALTLNPADAGTHTMFAIALSSTEQVQNALEQIQQAERLSPLYFRAYHTGALVWLNAHQYGRSAEQANQLVSLNPNGASGHEDLGTAYIFEGKYPEAVQQFQQELADGGDGEIVSALLGVAYARWGKNTQAEQQLHDLKRASAQEYVPPFWFAMLYASLGVSQKALDALDQAYREHDAYMVFLKVTPFLDSLHSDPRFQKLVRGMNFPS